MPNNLHNRFFSIIGAQRSGTTYLYKMLDQHPEIAMNKTIRPEPKFFLSDKYKSSTVDNYLDMHFEKQEIPMVYGEKSTSYLEYPQLAENIEAFLPECKILVLLRNPIDRAVSHYSFSKENNIELRTPEEALDINNENQIPIPKHLSVSPYTYISRGIYFNFLEAYMQVFKSRIKVVLFEDLVGNIQTIQDIYAFLGVSDSFVPANIDMKQNASAGVQISEQLRSRLYEFYGPYNELLLSKLGVSLNAWKQ